MLEDILDTPGLPGAAARRCEGEIAQRTEDLVGPYELHDFFLYYMLRCGFPPREDLPPGAARPWADVYDREIVLKWLKTFYRRFFAQQFKRNCLPDGPEGGHRAPCRPAATGACPATR